MQTLGYHLVHYDLDTEDSRYPGHGDRQSKDIVKGVLEKEAEDGNLLAMQHDTIAQSSGNLTEFILQLISAKGWEGMFNSSFGP